MLTTFSTKKTVKLTTRPLCPAMPCCMLASEDGMEGDICHGKRWQTGPRLLPLLQFTYWTWVGQSSPNGQTPLRVKPLQLHAGGWSPEVMGLCSSCGNLLCSGTRQHCICSVGLKLQIYFCCCFVSISFKLLSRTERFSLGKNTQSPV